MPGEGTVRQWPETDVFPWWFLFAELLTGGGGRPTCVRDESEASVSGTWRDVGEAGEHAQFAMTNGKLRGGFSGNRSWKAEQPGRGGEPKTCRNRR